MNLSLKLLIKMSNKILGEEETKQLIKETNDEVMRELLGDDKNDIDINTNK